MSDHISCFQGPRPKGVMEEPTGEPEVTVYEITEDRGKCKNQNSLVYFREHYFWEQTVLEKKYLN